MKIVKTILSLVVLLVAAVAEGTTVTLTSETGEVTLQNNDVLTGTGGSETHVTIAAGATVTLRDVDITSISTSFNYPWAGITCEGNATIILQGLNKVCGGYEEHPGIYVPPGSTLTIKGDGALDAGSNGYGAGIGGGLYIDCGNIVISNGVITATGGENFAAGIGGGQEAACGSITILGGTVTATGGLYAPGIGCGAVGTCGNIAIDEGVRCFTANGGEVAPCSVGAGLNGVVGTVDAESGEITYGTVKVADEAKTYTIDDSPIPGIEVSPFIYNPCITNITSATDWDAFASRVSRGIDAYEGLTVTLAADIVVSTMVGSTSGPFSGAFDGGGHSLEVSLSGTGSVAPFGVIRGATIRNLNVSGSVAGGNHSGGLVGLCFSNSGQHTISNCIVSVNITAANYAGGIVGHGGSGGPLIIRDTVFSGAISGFANCVGGILGWCDNLTLTIDNCLTKGSFVPGSGGKYHPIACANNGNNVAATVANAYYLNTMTPTAPAKNTIASTASVPVSVTYIPFEWVYEVTAADGVAYYKSAEVVRLTSTTGTVTLPDKYVLTGTGGQNTHVVIAPGATVLFRDVNIPGDVSNGKVGVTCEGDAVINFSGTGTVTGGGESPGIQVSEGSTLVIQGTGRLDVVSSGGGDGIVGEVVIDDALINISGDNGYTLVPGIEIAEDESNAAAIARHDGRSERVWLNGRTLRRDGSYNTLCLPFSMNAAQIAASPLANAIIEDLDSASVRVTGNGLTMCFTNVTEIVAGRPYVVRWAPAQVIRSTEDWNAFAESVTGGNSYEGVLVKLDADISVSTIAGTDGRPFRGVFDGCGHMIDVSMSAGGEGLALFWEIRGATIQNVRVRGSVNSSFRRPSTFAAFVEGECTIQNCWSEVAIVSANPNWVDAGGIVARVTSGGTLHITDCAFTGSITYSSINGYEGGGMVGWTQNNASVIVRNCLFMPSSVKITKQDPDSKAYVFVSGETRGDLSNCYYNDAAASAPLNKEGTQIFSGIHPAALAQRLGGNWEVRDSKAVPKMNAVYEVEATVDAPMFNAVTVSAATANAGGEILDFVGSTSPVTLADGSRSVLVIEADGTLAFADAGAVINSCRAYFQLHGLGALQGVTRYTLSYGEDGVEGDLTPPATGGYGLWAAQNGVAGAWNETDANGVCNVFRYAFDKPSGAFADTPLLAITIENGNAVIHTPPLVNADGFTFGIVATDALGGGNAVAYTLDPSGRTVIPVANKPARFFRLRAVEAE